MNQQDEPRRTCAGCGTAENIYVGQDSDKVYCLDCLVKLAGKDVEEKAAALAKAPPPARPYMKIAAAVLCAAAVVVLLVRLPALRDSFQPKKPLRQGFKDTDAATDRCIDNLWRMSVWLQESGRPGAVLARPGDALVCPASRAQYVLVSWPDDVKVRCPDPARHGLKSLQVGRKNPIPEAVR